MPADPITLAALAPVCRGVVFGDGAVAVTDVTHDSRAAGVGVLFVAVRGRTTDGHRFVPTPEATDFQRMLRRMVDAGVDVAAVEVSSHALSLGRVAETRFRVGAFTNLSQDHLDFHGDMESYESAKAQLFRQCDDAVIWVDDAAGARIARSLPIPVATVGTGVGTDLRVGDTAHSFSGSDFVLEGASRRLAIHVPLAGGFNVANAAVAAACARRLGVDDAAIVAG